jgi:hypothetical protein
MRMKVDETYRRNMKNKEPQAVDSASFSEFTLPDNVDELSPFLYFKIFWDDTITQNIVEQTGSKITQHAADIQHRTSSSCRFRTNRAVQAI